MTDIDSFQRSSTKEMESDTTTSKLKKNSALSENSDRVTTHLKYLKLNHLTKIKCFHCLFPSLLQLFQNSDIMKISFKLRMLSTAELRLKRPN